MYNWFDVLLKVGFLLCFEMVLVWVLVLFVDYWY